MLKRPAVGVAGLALLDGLVVLTLAASLVPSESRLLLWIGGLSVAAVVAAIAAIIASGLQRVWLRPLRRLAGALDMGNTQDVPSLVDSSPLPEVGVLGNAVRRLQSRLLSAVEHSQREREELGAIFEHMADGLLVLGDDERVVLANPTTARLLGRPVLLDRPLPEVARDSDLIQIVRAARDGTPVIQLIELRPDPLGPRRWLQVAATRLPPGQRRLVLLQDVTDLRHAEAARRDFVANVSHELRTPVASLKALVETLEGSAREDPVASADFLRRMHVEVDGLAHLVSELLALARAEAGRLDLVLGAFDVDQLIQESVDRIQPYAARVGLSVRVAPQHQPGLRISADGRRTGQVLSNLLANAVKFTPPGGCVELGAARGDELVELWVADNGVGIETDQLVRVFERFYKIDASRSGNGTGLGLAICKHLVRAHGGHIWAESPGPGRGATFRFTLPATANEEARAKGPPTFRQQSVA